MSLDVSYRGRRFAGKATIRQYCGWILCALLLIFCVNAKAARYEIHKTRAKLAITQAYLDGEETIRKLPKTALLLLCCVGIVGASSLIRPQAILLPITIPSLTPFRGFDPEFHLRPPPVR